MTVEDRDQREWGLDAAGEEAALIATELVTNAVLSTQAHQLACPVRIWMLGDAASVLFLTWDATRPAPVRRDAAPGPSPRRLPP